MSNTPKSVAVRVLSLVLIVSPLIFLLGDFMRFPVLLNGCSAKTAPVTVQGLFQTQTASQGTFQGHHVLISLDSIEDSHYLSFLKTHPTALAVAVDHENPSKPYWGGLIRAVLRKLDSISPSDAAALRQVITGREPVSGEVVSLPLHIPSEKFAAFPVDQLYVIGIKSRTGDNGQGKDQQLAILANGMRALMGEADRDKIENLIVPCVGVDPRDDQTVQYEEYFPAVFKPLGLSGRPRYIYLSVYQDLVDSYGQPQLAAIESSWSKACDEARKESVLVREQLRLVIAALFIALIVSSTHVKINVKTFLIIAGAFLGLGVGAMQLAGFFIQDWDVAYRLVVYVGLMLFLAIAFPFLSKWNPGKIFGK